MALAANVTFTAGSPNSQQSTLAATPNQLVANGSSNSVLLATIKDAFANPVPGKTVTFAGGANDTISPLTQATDGNGIAMAQVSSIQARTGTVTATTLASISSTQVSWLPGPVAVSQSSFVVSPNTLVANGVGVAAVTLTLKDAYGNAVYGQGVVLSENYIASGNSTTQLLAMGPTDGNGLFQANSLTTTLAGMHNITVQTTGLNANEPLHFIAGSPNASKSLLTASPNSNVMANGEAAVALTATFADAFGNPTGSQNVTVVSSTATDVLSHPAGITSTAGVFTSQLQAQTAGSRTLTATAGPAVITTPVSFVPALYPPYSALVANPNSIAADNTTTTTLTLTAKDGYNAPMQNTNIVWADTVPGSTFSAPRGRTDTLGQATVTLHASTAGNHNVLVNVLGTLMMVPVQVSTIAPACNGHVGMPKVSYPTLGSGSFRDVVSADFNGDGNMDLAVLNFYGTFTVELGKGNGLFGPPTTYSEGPITLSIASGDLDGDGLADIVVSDVVFSRVAYFLGRSNGTFAPLVAMSTDSSPQGVVLADFNGDGRLDIATANSSPNSVSVLLSTGAAQFAATVNYATTGTPTSLDAAALMGTTVKDIVVSNPAANTISILPNNGSGVFGAATVLSAGTSPSTVVAKDINGDGLADIIVASTNEKSFSTIINQGGGMFAAQVKNATADTPITLAVAPMNVSTLPDIAVLTTGAYLSIFENQGGGAFSAGPLIGSEASAVTVRLLDINNDGKLDVLIPVSSQMPRLPIHYNFGTYDFIGQSSMTLQGPRQMVAADFNLDGNVDIFAVSYTGNHGLYMGAGAGLFSTSSVSSAGCSQPIGAAVADFNEDGYADVVVTNGLGNTLGLYLNNKVGNFNSIALFNAGSQPSFVAAQDVDADGHVDAVVLNVSDKTVGVFLGTGNGTFQAMKTYATGNEPQAMVLGDFNGDGTLDVAVVNNGDSTVSVLYNDGKGSLTTSVTLTAPTLVSTMAAHDFDGDGLLDFIATPANSTSLTLFKNTGTSFTQSTPITTSMDTATLYAVDMNGDGLPDVAGLSRYGSTMTIFYNLGSAVFSTGSEYPMASVQPEYALFQDLNGYQKIDIIAASFIYNNINVALQSGCY